MHEAPPPAQRPQAFVELDALPARPDGSLDEERLRSPVGDGDAYVVTRSESERLIAELFGQALALTDGGRERGQRRHRAQLVDLCAARR